MKENLELEKSDIDIDSDILLEKPNVISVYIETWFDADKKFGVVTSDDDDKCLNFYGDYDIENDSLKLCYHIVSNEGTTHHDYEPIGNEVQIIKDAIAEKIMLLYGQTPKEFCDETFDEEPNISMEECK